MFKLPKPITSDRFIIREFTKEECDARYALMLQEETQNYATWEVPLTPEQLSEMVIGYDETQRNNTDNVVLAVADPISDKVIGCIGMNPVCNADNGGICAHGVPKSEHFSGGTEALPGSDEWISSFVEGQWEIGYIMGIHGRGYATESVKAILNYLNSNPPLKVFASTHPENKASQNVLVKCGFIRVPEIDGGGEIMWQFTCNPNGS